MDDFYVYAYLDQTRPGRYTCGSVSFLLEPFYVGKGHGLRMLKHRWDATVDHRTRRIRAIKEAAGCWPEVLVLADGLSEMQAFQVEMETIRTIGRRATNTGPLTNLNDGGRGGSRGRTMSEETKAKISAKNRGRLRATGWRHSEEAKQKMRGPKSPEAVENMKRARANRPPVPESVREKIRRSMLGKTPWNKGMQT